MASHAGDRRRLIRPHWVAGAALVVLSFWLGAKWGVAQANRHQQRAHATAATATKGGLELIPAARAYVRPEPPRALPLPGEFEPQTAMVIVCNELLPCFPDVFKDLVAAVHEHVPVLCLIAGDLERQLALTALTEANLPLNAVRFAPALLDTMWIRDYGPFFVQHTDGTAFAADLDYSPADEAMEIRWRDDKAPRVLAELLNLPVDVVPLRLGGGNLMSNGEGLCVTTTTVLRDNRDRGYDADRIESILRERFGVRKWLCVRELEGERTGHVDMFVTFLAPDLAVVGEMDRSCDPVNAAILDEAADLLAQQQTSRGPMRVRRIPMPAPDNGVWRSYTNVILANGVVLVPTFRDVDPAIQDKVMSLYCSLLPDWRVVGINSDGLATSDGMLHCISRNVPGFVSLADIEKTAHRLGYSVMQDCVSPLLLGGWTIGLPAEQADANAPAGWEMLTVPRGENSAPSAGP